MGQVIMTQHSTKSTLDGTIVEFMCRSPRDAFLDIASVARLSLHTLSLVRALTDGMVILYSTIKANVRTQTSRDGLA